MYKIAIYGKGGIGKSTLSANISYLLTHEGHSVVQIGCDPKSDSTRLLLGGIRPTTVLETVRSGRYLRACDIVKTGKSGVKCIEAGGPEPGIGCAGRGILTAFSALEKMDLSSMGDVCVYDVLGDVVCGGFAIPMRPDYSDAVCIVTSGEFMSLYAANNILRGMRNFESDGPRIIGLVFNDKGTEGETDIIARFADAVDLPILSHIPRSRDFMICDREGCTVSELFPGSDATEAIRSVADIIGSCMSGEYILKKAKPLDDDQLNDLVRGRTIRSPRKGEDICRTGRSKDISTCAARGAALSASGIEGLTILIHGPDSCGFSISHTHKNHFLRECANNQRLPRLSAEMFCTGMVEDSCIFGGNDVLESKLRELVAQGKKDVVVVTTCAPSIMGDDTGDVVTRVSAETGAWIRLVKADGIFSGTAREGRELMRSVLFGRMKGGCKTDPRCVNLIGDSFGLYNTGDNASYADALLEMLGLRVGCRLFGRCDLAQLDNARSAMVNIVVSDDCSSLSIVRSAEKAGLEVFPKAFPRGIRATRSWIESVSKHLGIDLGITFDRIDREYEEALGRSKLSGKRIILTSTGCKDLDWIIDVLKDAGAVLVKVGSFPSNFKLDRTASSDHEVDEGYSMEKYLSDLDRLAPDLVIGPGLHPSKKGIRSCNHPPNCLSYQSSIDLLGHLDRVMSLPVRSGWRSDA